MVDHGHLRLVELSCSHLLRMLRLLSCSIFIYQLNVLLPIAHLMMLLSFAKPVELFSFVQAFKFLPFPQPIELLLFVHLFVSSSPSHLLILLSC